MFYEARAKADAAALDIENNKVYFNHNAPLAASLRERLAEQVANADKCMRSFESKAEDSEKMLLNIYKDRLELQQNITSEVEQKLTSVAAAHLAGVQANILENFDKSMESWSQAWTAMFESRMMDLETRLATQYTAKFEARLAAVGSNLVTRIGTTLKGNAESQKYVLENLGSRVSRIEASMLILQNRMEACKMEMAAAKAPDSVLPVIAPAEFRKLEDQSKRQSSALINLREYVNVHHEFVGRLSKSLGIAVDDWVEIDEEEPVLPYTIPSLDKIFSQIERTFIGFKNKITQMSEEKKKSEALSEVDSKNIRLVTASQEFATGTEKVVQRILTEKIYSSFVDTGSFETLQSVFLCI